MARPLLEDSGKISPEASHGDRVTRATILTIDGGGIRGIIPARIIAEIERRTGKAAAHLFDLIAGTSTGGILALALGIPAMQGDSQPKYRSDQLVELYQTYAPHIFSHSLSHSLTSISALT